MIADFKNFLDKHEIHEQILAIGVSGGSDSLALVLSAHQQLQPLGYRLVALTVDHQLRKSSLQEAQYVARIMAEHNIEHHILTWDGAKPETGIEEAARKARYNLIYDWCKKHQINALLIAHQQEDQAETFLMRLQRGSGLDGVCGMRECSKWKDLTILRPLLSAEKKELQDFLIRQNIKWVEDESNDCDDFLRVKMRKFLPAFCEHTGISIKTIFKTVERLQKAQSLLEEITQFYISKHCHQWQNAGYSFKYERWLKFHAEIKFRFLSYLLKTTGNLEYIPRAERVLSLIERMNNPNFKSATLGNCEIILYDQSIWIVPQHIDLSGYNKESWEKYIQKYPAYKKIKLPFKMRAALLADKEPFTPPKHS